MMGIDFRFPSRPDWAWLKASFPDDILLHVDREFADVANLCRSRMAYLATPYSLNVVGEGGRFSIAEAAQVEIKTARWARHFAIAGVTVCSPILLSCAITNADVEGHIDPLDEKFWEQWCRPMMYSCGVMIIPPMVGWDQSLGVWREACWALQNNVPVHLIREGSELGGAG